MELSDALRDLDEEQVYQLVDDGIAKGIPALDIISELNKGMVGVGELFASGDYFLSQLIYSGEILKAVMERLDPLLKQADGTTRTSAGTVVIGTVKGDIHDIGKNIVASLLAGHGFEVVDLGVDVPAEKFVEAVKETGTKVLGLSALLNFTYPEMKTVIDAMKEAGLRDQVTIIVGGAPCNEQVREFTGADYAATDAVTGINICKQVYARA